MLLSQAEMLVQVHPTVCAQMFILLQQIKLPSARMKCYSKNASSCKLALLLPPSNEALANHLLALQLTCNSVLHLCWLITAAEAKENKHIEHMHTLLKK